ncbi:MAG: hypothetical protein EXS40_08120 [Opitutaceae bacterium]|nr:hypothetical protein [Opitutaceae bacterium]
MLAALDTNLPGFCVYRRVYYPDGRMGCDYVSPNLEQVVGSSAEQFLENACCLFERIHPDDLPALRKTFADVLASGGPVLIAVRLRLPQNGEFFGQFRSQLAERRSDGAHVRDGVVVEITAVTAWRLISFGDGAKAELLTPRRRRRREDGV